MLMVAQLYAGALVESPDVPHVGWRVGAYVGRSCAVMPSLAYGTSDMPDPAALADAAPYVDDPAMRCFASRLRRREPLRIAVFGTSVVAGNRCNHVKSIHARNAALQISRFTRNGINRRWWHSRDSNPAKRDPRDLWSDN